MANYYTEFSFEIDLTEEQHKKGVLLFESLNAEENGFTNLRNLVLEEDTTPNFDFKPYVFSKGNVKWWFSSDGGESSTNHIALFLHYCIVNFNFPPCGFEWSNSCSKPQLDSFSGGAVWITKEGFENISTNDWLEEHRVKSDLSNPSQ